MSHFTSQHGQGAILLIYSVILSKGVQNIKLDLDMQDTCLINEYGYAS